MCMKCGHIVQERAILTEKWNFEGTYVVSSYIEKEMWKP